MKLINNRYKIIEFVERDSIYTKYIVKDLLKGNDLETLYLINSSEASSPLIEFCTNHFYKISSLNHPHIISVYSFGIVEYIDDKPCQDLKYFYTTEYNEWKAINLTSYTFTKDEILDIYIKLSRALEYLHFHGIIYKYLGIDTIAVYTHENGLDVKLLDLISLQKKSLNRQTINNFTINYLAPELIINESEIEKYTDVYSLGTILYHLKANENFKHSLLTKKIECCVENPELKWDLNLYKLIYDMTNVDYNKRIQTIHEVNRRIKIIFSYNKSIKDKHFVERLNFKTPLIGRSSEISRICSFFPSSIKDDNNNNLFVIKGYKGLGKTRLITEVLYKMYIKQVKNVYIDITNDDSSFYKIAPKILKQIYKVTPAAILEKYSKELVKLTPELGANINVTPSKELADDKELLRLYDRVSNYILDIGLIKPIALAIDDFHLSDSSFIKFLDYLISLSQTKNSQLLIIIGINEDAIDLNRTQELLERYSNQNRAIHIKLSRLSLDETGQIIDHILGYINNSIDIVSKIYQETDGVPSLIEELLRQLFSQGLLAIEYNSTLQSYEWQLKTKDYSKLKLSSNLDDGILKQINSFSKTKRDILEAISIFNTSTSLNLISKILRLDSSLTEAFDGLTKLKILNEKLEDWGYTYDINNLQVKGYIYNSMDESKRLLLHKRASELLEELYDREGRENKDELIFHLLKSNQFEKVIDYCFESGKNMLRLRIYSQALDFFKKAYELTEDLNNLRTLELIMKIGETYQKIGKNKDAIEFFNKAIEISNIINSSEIEIDAKNQIGQIYLLRNELDKALEYFTECINDSERINYFEGLFRAAYLLSKTYINTRQLHEIDIICDKYLDLAYKYNRFDYVGIFLNQKGIVKYLKGHSINAVKYFNDSIQFLEKGEKVQDTAGPINSIGQIYLEHYQDIKTARRHFERALSISQLYHRVEDMVKSYNNIADCYILEAKYQQAETVLNKNIVLSLEYEDEIIRFISYVKLVECYLYLEEYKKAYKCLLRAQKEIINYPIESLHYEKYIEMSIKFYMAMGSYEKSIELIDYFDNSFRNIDLRMKQRIRIINFLAKNNLGIFVDDNELNDILNTYRKTSFHRDRRLALFIGTVHFFLKADYGQAIKLYNEDKELCKIIDDSFLNVRHKYLGTFLDNNNDPITSLERLLVEIFNERCDELRWIVYFCLGELYLAKKEYYRATTSYLNALDTIKILYNNTPEEFREKYLISNSKYLVKKRLLYIEKLICNDSSCDDFDNTNNIDLKNYFDVSPLRSLIQHPDFYKMALEQYKKQFPLEIDSINDLLNSFTNNAVDNIELTVGLISKSLLASSATVVSKIDGNYNKIISIGRDVQIYEISHILEKVEQSGSQLNINNIEGTYDNNENIIFRDVKALACLPLLNAAHSDWQETNNDRRKILDKKNVVGFLYLESDIVFNNFTELEIEKSKALLPLISLLLDNYYLKIHSSIDKLTGVYERKYFEKVFKEQINKSNASEFFSIIMCDIDHFKNVNDNYGHQMGDKILSEVGDIIKRSIRKTDLVARYGGEEFIVLLPNTIKDQATLVAEKIRKSFKEGNLLGREGNLTISCGISSYPEDSQNPESIIEKADQALYKAKDEGRNRSIVWEEGIAFSNRRVDKLAGIITGNTVADQRNVLVLVKAIEMISKSDSKDNKVYELLGLLMDAVEAEASMLLILNDDESILNEYHRKRFTNGWTKKTSYNVSLIEKIIQTKQGEFLIDWEGIGTIDMFTGTPNWESIIIMPILNNGHIKAIIYLSAQTKNKEFDYSSFNLVKLTSGIIGAII